MFYLKFKINYNILIAIKNKLVCNKYSGFRNSLQIGKIFLYLINSDINCKALVLSVKNYKIIFFLDLQETWGIYVNILLIYHKKKLIFEKNIL